MQDNTTELQRIKMILTSLLLVLAGTALIGIEQRLNPPSDGLLAWIPYAELGGILVGAGLLSIWIDHLFRREQQALSDQRLRSVLRDHAPVMRDAVLDAFAANQDDLKRVATPETLDQIATNALGLRIKDQEFADDLYADLQHHVIDSGERWLGASLDIRLDKLPSESGRPDYFSVTVRWEYAVTPIHPQRRFICLSDRREYAEIASARGDTSAWFYKPDGVFDARDRQTYELVHFAIDGEDQTVRRSSRKAYQQYTVDVGSERVEASEPVTISYTYRTVTPTTGHLLFFDIEQPTKDIRVSFDYSNCDIGSVSVVDLIPSARPTRIERSPGDVPSSVVRVEVEGWTFPRSGVAFVWTDLDPPSVHQGGNDQ